MLYRILDHEVTEVAETSVIDEALYEKDVEDWVSAMPEILGEPLIIIGRQVQVDEGKDRIDLLALDKSASLVVIELKRDLVGGSDDLQALRYAAQVSQWSQEDVRRQAEGFWKALKSPRGTLAQEVDEFCDAGYELNAEQRVILAGRDIKPRLGTVALWFRKHRVNLKVVAINVLKDGDRLYVKPQVVVPVASEDSLRVPVSIGSSDKPWLVDGQQWHLEQRCSPKGRKILEALVELIAQAAPEADGPNWNQKFYVSWRSGPKNWIVITSQANQANLDIGGFSESAARVAEQLGFSVFKDEAELAEKFAFGSSVGVLSNAGRLNVIVKFAKDIEGERAAPFVEMLSRAWHEFSGTAPLTVPIPLNEPPA